VSQLHMATATIAIVAGLLVLLQTKGTRRHRRFGYVYVASMVTLNVSSFFIFRLTGEFSPFHVAAFLSLATVIAGFLPVYWRRPADGWLQVHFQFMAWSYIGLLAATASELAVRIPESPFWWAVIASSAVIIMAGALVLAHNRPKLLARYGRAR
ncbi:MAG TPA: DUF2306 domain-containing protein, partial [Steroidobacteraceae bacterium]